MADTGVGKGERVRLTRDDQPALWVFGKEGESER